MPNFFESVITDSRRVPWDGLGASGLNLARSAEEALDMSGLLWQVEKRPLFLNNGQRVHDAYANVRTCDETILGVVGKDYRVINNEQAFGWTSPLLNEGVEYIAAGAMGGDGRRTWLCAKFRDYQNVLGDRIDMYVVITNSFNSRSSIKVCLTPIRVVCANALTYSLRNAQRVWSLKHTQSAKHRLDQVAQTIQRNHILGKRLEENADRLANRKISLEEFVNRLLPIPVGDAKVTERMIANTHFIRNQIFEMGESWDLKPFKGTSYAALQTLAAFASHGTPIRKTADFRENRFQKLIDGHSLLQRASDLALAI